MRILLAILILVAIVCAAYTTPIEQEATSEAVVTAASADVKNLADVDAGDAHANVAGRNARLFGVGFGIGYGGYGGYGYRPRRYGYGYGYRPRPYGYGYGYGRPYYGYGHHHHHYGYYG